MRASHRLAFAIIIAASFTVPAYAQRPSFSCRSVHRCPEITICATPVLARLDSMMAGLYFGLQGVSHTAATRAVLAGQRVWLARRNACGCDASCLVDRYEQRIDELNRAIHSLAD